MKQKRKKKSNLVWAVYCPWHDAILAPYIRTRKSICIDLICLDRQMSWKLLYREGFRLRRAKIIEVKRRRKDGGRG